MYAGTGMRSSERAAPAFEAFDWRAAGLRYYPLGQYFRRQFGRRAWKVSLDAGCDCPNVDGTLASDGCLFCNVASYSPSRRGPRRPLTRQIDDACQRLGSKRKCDALLAYFQPATNTHAPVEQLRAWWSEALSHPKIVGLIVGTRPDCVADPILDLAAEFSGRTWMSIEYGLQTVHERSLRWLRRRHGYDAFRDAVARSRSRGIRVGAHVILGLPGESRDDMRATARELARLAIDSVKLHNLYVPRDTRLADLLAAGAVRLPGRDEYASYVVDFLEVLHPGCVVDRLGADAPPEFLVAPDWCLDKPAVRAAVDAEFARRDTWQGREFGSPRLFPAGRTGDMLKDGDWSGPDGRRPAASRARHIGPSERGREESPGSAGHGGG